jgi:uncharacterized SAM-binding protein YcdF (DUF218 family)
MNAPDFLDSQAAITKFLFINDPPAKVDLCFVLGCPTPTNMKPAIELYECGLAPFIMIAGHGPAPQPVPESEIFRDYAIQRGVPADAMVLESASTNTRDNFAMSAPIIAERFGWENIATVALVTKPFHMRRAVMTARRQWPPHVRLLCRPSVEPDDCLADSWWRTEAGRGYVLNELRAIGAYALQGDLGGF